MKNEKLYKEIFDLPGVSGSEHKVREYMRSHMEGLCDEIVMDNLGGIFAVKKGPVGSPVVMIAGHMDEVGACVSGIRANGLIEMKALGGLGADVFSSQHMEIHTDNDVFPGVTSTVPPHLKAKGATASSFDDLTLDIGADSKEQVHEWGIRHGDMIAPVNNYRKTYDGKKIISKAVDDRWGCGMVLELLKDLEGQKLDCTVVIGANVQEEVGLRGAKVSAQKFNPDIFIALDASPAGDRMPGVDNGYLGKGFLLRYLDRAAIMHRGMKKWFIEVAEKNNIDYQYFYSAGGTDAGNAQYAHDGVLVATVGLPARYIHSTTTMFAIHDHEAAKAEIRALLKDINSEKLEEIKANV